MSGVPSGPWPVVAICGGGAADPQAELAASALGAVVMRLGAALLTGGRGGVMAAASRGARQARGDAAVPPVIALLPGADRAAANPWADLVLPTALGDARNAVLVTAAQVVLVVGGGPGTLSEVGLARKAGRPVVVVGGTGGVADRAADLLPGDPGLHLARDAAHAARLLEELLTGLLPAGGAADPAVGQAPRPPQSSR